MEGNMNQNLRESTIHGTNDYPFVIYYMRNFRTAFSVSLHWHEEVEIIYVERGTLLLTIDKEHYTAGAGALFMVNSQTIHTMSVEELDTVYYTLLFPLSFLQFHGKDAASRDYLIPLSEHTMLFPTEITNLPLYTAMLADVKELIGLYHEKPNAYTLSTKCVLLRLICRFCSTGYIITSSYVSPYNMLHREILGYLNDNYNKTLNLETIAKHFHMSPKYISRYFKKTFHVTLTEYLTHLRLESSVNLLQTTELSITEIALSCGFSSCSYFNKKFKSAFGKPPTAYRH